MPRISKPWFNRQTGWWCTDLAGRRYKLAKGQDQKKLARQKFHALMQQCDANPPAESGAPATVPSTAARTASSSLA